MSTLHLPLKIELDKEHIRYCLLFCFYKKKVLHTKLFVRRVIAIRTCVNWFKWFKKW